MNGDLGEILLYNRDVTEQQKADIEDGLAQKWGIAVSSCAVDSSLTLQNNLLLWLDGRDTDCDGNPANEPDNGAKLPVWKDKSLSKNDASNDVTENQPTYSTNLFSGPLPGVYFAGYPEKYNLNAINSGDDFTISIAYYEDTSNTNPYFFGGTGTSGIVPRLSSGSSYFTGQVINLADQTTSGLSQVEYNNSAAAILTYRYSKTSGEASIFRDGLFMIGPPVAAAFSLTADNLYYLGGDGFNSTSYFNGTIGEILFYNSALAEGNRHNVESYLSNKWAIGISKCTLNSSFPYAGVGTGINLWYDATDTDCDGDISNEPVSGSDLDVWYDKKKNYDDHTYYDMRGYASPPKYYTNVQNQLPAVRFNGNAGNFMNAGPIIINDNYSIFTVLKVNNTSFMDVFGVIDSDPDFYPVTIYPRISLYNLQALGYTYNKSTQDVYGQTASNIISGDFHVISQVYTPDNSDIYTDGYPGTSGTNFNYTPTENFRTLGVNDADGNYFSGDIGEFIQYNTAMSAPDRIALQYYLGRKWGIQMACYGDSIPSSGVNASLVMWFDAYDTDCNAITGDEPTNLYPLSIWKDKTGHGYDMQSVSTPTYVQGAVNGKPAVHFNSLSNMTTAALSSISDQFTIAIVLTLNDYTNYPTEEIFSASGAFDFNLMFDSGAFTSTFSYNDGGNINSTPVTPTMSPATYMPYILIGRMDHNSSLATVTTAGGGASNSSTASISSSGVILFDSGDTIQLGNNSSSNYDGYLAELLVYNTAVSDSELAIISSYLADKWGVSTSAPSGGGK